MKKIFTLGLSVLAGFAITACGKNDGPVQPEPEKKIEGMDKYGWFETAKLQNEVTLNIAVNDSKLRITNTGAAFMGLDGSQYNTEDLLPNWRYMEKRLNMKFNDTATGDGRPNNWKAHEANAFKDADLINGNVTDINTKGQANQMLDLMEYINVNEPEKSKLPNISKFVKENNMLAKTMMNNGKLYYAAYFDGFGEPEHFFHMNQTMVKNILDSEDNAGSAAAADGLADLKAYNNYATNASVEITEGLGNEASKRTITKLNVGKNAVDAIKSASTGAQIITNLKEHLKAVYKNEIGAGKAYAKLSDIYISEAASYDTDELVALMAAIHNNEALAQGVAEDQKTHIKIFSQRKLETNKANQRAVNVLQGLGIMYGVRGALESKCNGCVYLDKDNKIQDGRATDEWINMFDYTKGLYSAGLIENEYNNDNGIGSVKTNQLFMIHDYMTNSTNQANTGLTGGGNVDFQAVLPPVNNWDDGDDATDYFHFAESNRSGSKSETWCIPARVKEDPAKLDAALTLIDYIYSIEGDMLFNYGPNKEQVELYGGTNVTGYCSDVKVESMSTLRGVKINHYKMSDLALRAMSDMTFAGEDGIARSANTGKGWNTWSKAETGANLPIGFIREYFAETETLTPNGIAGYNKVSTAFGITKTYKTLQLDPKAFYGKDVPYFTAVPGIALSSQAQTVAANLTKITSIFSGDQNNDQNVSYVKYGWGGNSGKNITKDTYKTYIDSEMKGNNGLIALYQSAYNDIKNN